MSPNHFYLTGANNMTKDESNTVLRAVKKFNDAKPRMSVQQLLVLLAIYNNKTVEQPDLEDMTGLNKMSISRTIVKEAKTSNPLLAVRVDYYSGRRNIITMTEAGNKLFESL